MKYFALLFFTFLLMVSCGGETPANPDPSSEGTVEFADTISTDSIDFPAALSFDAFCAIFEEFDATVESLDSLFDLYEFNKKDFSQLEKDSACMLYVGQMHKITGAVEEEDVGTVYEDLKTKYEPYGFKVGGGEGYLWLIVNTDAAGKRFEADLSKDARELMRLGEITGKQYSADAGMLISYDEWADVLLDLEDRLVANKDSRYVNTFMYTYLNFLTNFMYGQDNTPTVGWGEEKKFEDDVLAAYEKVLADESHNTGQFIEEHMGRMEASNYEWDWNTRWTPSFELIRDILELD